MKKLVTLLAAAGMIVSAAAPASAVDVKVDGEYRHSFSTGQSFSGANSEDFRHRMRINLTMAASENVSAYTQFQLNHGKQYGAADKHGANGEFTVRQMYLDWVVPGTPVKVRMGRQGLGLPAEAFGGNSILGAGFGSREGIVLTSPVTDWLGLTAIWTRLGIEYDDTAKAFDTDLDQNNSDDMYAVAANLKFEGISGSVYAAYATLDEKGTAGAGGYPKNTWNDGRPAGEGNAYWLGFTTTVSMFDPFVLKLSAAYGEFNAESPAHDANGWNVQAKASYKTAFGTPVLGAWYFSGVDKKDGKGYMPNAGYFNGTNHFYDGYVSLTNPSNTNNFGTWAVQAGIEGVSFLEGLTHDFHVTYMQGTNEVAADKLDAFYTSSTNGYNGHLTEDDAVVEFTLNNVYQIYKNLAAHLELAYIINDFDKAATYNKGTELSEDDWYASLTFQYKF